MADQNRKSRSRSKSNYGSSSGSAPSNPAFFRGAFILLVALTLSFGLGFFVLARMLPANGANGTDGAASGQGAVGDKGNAGSGKHQDGGASAGVGAPHPALSHPIHPAIHNQDGPTLLPDTEVQTPDPVDASGKHAGSTEADAANEARKRLGQAGDENGSGTAPGDDSGDPAPAKRIRRDRADTGAVQAPSSPDSPAAGVAAGSADGSTKPRASDGSTTAKNGLYRVQIGVFSTKEKAEEAARSAADKGVTTSVRAFRRDGIMLYRVQHSAHTDRAKAELDKQKLIDAGFDATISDPT